MGPPRNVRVQATVEGYLVTWEPPNYGRNQVRLYTVRWFSGPSEHLYGRAETTDTYYLGKQLPHVRELCSTTCCSYLLLFYCNNKVNNRLNIRDCSVF